MKYLNEKQLRCIELMVENNMEISTVAKEIGVSRTTIYNWMKDERFKAELDKSEQEIKTRVQHIFVRRLPEAIEKLWKLTDANNSEGNRVKFNAVVEWLNRTLGKVNTAVTLEDKRVDADDSLSMDDLMKRVKERLSTDTETL